MSHIWAPLVATSADSVPSPEVCRLIWAQHVYQWTVDSDNK
jgi:hypothetical protein